jgi:hypothetical protein
MRRIGKAGVRDQIGELPSDVENLRVVVNQASSCLQWPLSLLERLELHDDGRVVE